MWMKPVIPGPNLFDRTQRVLSYGVLSSPDDLDKVAESELASLRKKLGVQRLHAAELGMYRLDDVVDTLLVFCRRSTGYGLMSGRWLNGITPLFRSLIRYLIRD
ncbi:Uncharacterised protein [Escherichia coli]|uniref:Uncharacterized protein n=1 Tax=Escherichia coli TaxID=562 RepID=A0A376YJ31_ECOLX|nr:Uncharacterised protein [Escherichia coli]